MANAHLVEETDIRKVKTPVTMQRQRRENLQHATRTLVYASSSRHYMGPLATLASVQHAVLVL